MTTTANADPAEIAKFAALAQNWWDPRGPSKPLHELNPLRLQYIERVAGVNGKQVLDVGCGGGILSEAMARGGATVLGIDLAKAVLDVAELHAIEADVRVDYRNISAEDLVKERPAAFDVVTCMEMLEHVPGPRRHYCGVGETGQARRPCHRVHAESKSPGICGGNCRRRIHRSRTAARHARVHEVHQAFRACPLGPYRRTGARGFNGRCLQPIDPGIFSLGEHAR